MRNAWTVIPGKNGSSDVIEPTGRGGYRVIACGLSEADAKLIATAPLLAEALSDFINSSRIVCVQDELAKALHRLDASFPNASVDMVDDDRGLAVPAELHAVSRRQDIAAVTQMHGGVERELAEARAARDRMTKSLPVESQAAVAALRLLPGGST